MDVITKKSFELALNWNNVILFLFACEKISRGSREHRRREYFSLRNSHQIFMINYFPDYIHL